MRLPLAWSDASDAAGYSAGPGGVSQERWRILHQTTPYSSFLDGPRRPKCHLIDARPYPGPRGLNAALLVLISYRKHLVPPQEHTHGNVVVAGWVYEKSD